MENKNLPIISGDVYLIIKYMNNIGWDKIRETSINRLLYIAGVVYSFKFPEAKNIFEDDYHFVVTLNGPIDPQISGAINHLVVNEIIEKEDSGFEIKKISEDLFYNLPFFKDKKMWIDDISYIIGIYGEDKMYDFIFRDPEYKTSLKGNSNEILDLSLNNETVKFLNRFKEEFESQIKENVNINNRQYLYLYFEYVFGTILRGENL